MKRRRITAILVAVLLLLSLCSCEDDPAKKQADSSQAAAARYTEMPRSGEDIGFGSYDDADGYHLVNQASFTHPAGYASKHIAHSYEALADDRLQELYDQLYDAYYCFSDEVGKFDGEYALRPLIVSGTDFEKKDVESAMIAVLDDHPEIFWMVDDFDLKPDFSTATTTISLNAVYRADEVVRMMKEIDAALIAFYDAMPADLTAYEREVYVYKYIIDNCEYDENISSSQSYEDEHPSLFNLYGVLIDKKAVCEGYSYTFDYLCSELGIDTVCICGTTVGEDETSDEEDPGLHLWNAVELDNEWYMVDCTWDDWDEDDDLGDVFLYLNVTDKVLAYDHTVDKTYSQIDSLKYNELESFINNFVPSSCTATEYCYYQRESVRLTSPDANALSQGLMDAYEKGRKSLLIYVDTDAYTAESLSEALFDGDQPYYEAYDIANNTLSGAPLDADADAVYYLYDERNLIVFELNVR